MYKLHIATRAQKELNKLKYSHQEAILIAFEEIKEEPFIGKPLTRELTGRFSYRVGPFRIIYKVKMKDNLVEIITAGHRSTVYD